MSTTKIHVFLLTVLRRILSSIVVGVKWKLVVLLCPIESSLLLIYLFARSIVPKLEEAGVVGVDRGEFDVGADKAGYRKTS